MTPQTFGWSESTWLLLDHYGILLGLFASVIALGGFCLAIYFTFFNKQFFRRWFTRNRFPNAGQLSHDHKQWDAIIFTVSKADTPNWVIEASTPKVIALLATSQSKNEAEQVAAFAKARNIKVLDPIYLNDPDNIQECQLETRHLIERIRQQDEDSNLALDLTGGKATMSLGAFMAATEEQVTSLYLSTVFDTALKKPDMRTAKLITVSGV